MDIRTSYHECGHAVWAIRNGYRVVRISRRQIEADNGNGTADGVTEVWPDPASSERLSDRLGWALSGIAGEEVGRARLGFELNPLPQDQQEWFMAAWRLAEADGVTKQQIADDPAMQQAYVAKVPTAYAPIFEAMMPDPLLDVLVEALTETPVLNADAVAKIIQAT